MASSHLWSQLAARLWTAHHRLHHAVAGIEEEQEMTHHEEEEESVAAEEEEGDPTFLLHPSATSGTFAVPLLSPFLDQSIGYRELLYHSTSFPTHIDSSSAAVFSTRANDIHQMRTLPNLPARTYTRALRAALQRPIDEQARKAKLKAARAAAQAAAALEGDGGASATPADAASAAIGELANADDLEDAAMIIDDEEEGEDDDEEDDEYSSYDDEGPDFDRDDADTGDEQDYGDDYADDPDGPIHSLYRSQLHPGSYLPVAEDATAFLHRVRESFKVLMARQWYSVQAARKAKKSKPQKDSSSSSGGDTENTAGATPASKKKKAKKQSSTDETSPAPDSSESKDDDEEDASGETDHSSDPAASPPALSAEADRTLRRLVAGRSGGRAQNFVDNYIGMLDSAPNRAAHVRALLDSLPHLHPESDEEEDEDAEEFDEDDEFDDEDDEGDFDWEEDEDESSDESVVSESGAEFERVNPDLETEQESDLADLFNRCVALTESTQPGLNKINFFRHITRSPECVALISELREKVLKRKQTLFRREEWRAARQLRRAEFELGALARPDTEATEGTVEPKSEEEQHLCRFAYAGHSQGDDRSVRADRPFPTRIDDHRMPFTSITWIRRDRYEQLRREEEEERVIQVKIQEEGFVKAATLVGARPRSQNAATYHKRKIDETSDSATSSSSAHSAAAAAAEATDVALLDDHKKQKITAQSIEAACDDADEDDTAGSSDEFDSSSSSIYVPVARLSLLAYYEVLIEPESAPDRAARLANENVFWDDASACVAIGLGTDRFKLIRKQPGWDSHSFGWHSDDGHVFHGHGSSSMRYTNSGFGPGDIVGGVAFAGISGTFFPVIGVDALWRVSVNFGDSAPFAFDVLKWERRLLEQMPLPPRINLFSDARIVATQQDKEDEKKTPNKTSTLTRLFNAFALHQAGRRTWPMRRPAATALSTTES